MAKPIRMTPEEVDALRKQLCEEWHSYWGANGEVYAARKEEARTLRARAVNVYAETSWLGFEVADKAAAAVLEGCDDETALAAAALHALT